MPTWHAHRWHQLHNKGAGARWCVQRARGVDSLFGWLVHIVAGSWRSTVGWFVWEKNTVSTKKGNFTISYGCLKFVKIPSFFNAKLYNANSVSWWFKHICMSSKKNSYMHVYRLHISISNNNTKEFAHKKHGQLLVSTYQLLSVSASDWSNHFVCPL